MSDIEFGASHNNLVFRVSLHLRGHEPVRRFAIALGSSEWLQCWRWWAGCHGIRWYWGENLPTVYWLICQCLGLSLWWQVSFGLYLLLRMQQLTSVSTKFLTTHSDTITHNSVAPDSLYTRQGSMSFLLGVVL